MLGSTVDADDAVQETMIRAWRSFGQFDGRASMRTWLYRIATNVCLDEIARRGRRARPMEDGPAGIIPERLVQRPRTHWLEPIPDARAIPADSGPAELVILRQSIRLAFVAALQHLAPKQRATLLLTEVLGWTAAEIAEALNTTIAAVNSALQRARSVLASRGVSLDPAGADPTALTDYQTALLDRYVQAFESYDVEALVSLLRLDAAFSMPPYELWLQGPDQVREWLTTHGIGCKGSRLLPSAGCASPTFGQYRAHPEGGHKPWALVILELDGDRIAGWNSFLDTETLFPLFGLPLSLSD